MIGTWQQQLSWSHMLLVYSSVCLLWDAAIPKQFFDWQDCQCKMCNCSCGAGTRHVNNINIGRGCGCLAFLLAPGCQQIEFAACAA
jgi:hypothetical protein